MFKLLIKLKYSNLYIFILIFKNCIATIPNYKNIN